eukprot:SAG31_NODE_33091_length_348_cov_0.606426_1_plen_115_part_11
MRSDDENFLEVFQRSEAAATALADLKGAHVREQERIATARVAAERRQFVEVEKQIARESAVAEAAEEVNKWRSRAVEAELRAEQWQQKATAMAEAQRRADDEKLRKAAMAPAHPV